MNIQWYPGHMTKAKRAMKEDVKLVDLVIELVDARAPLASRNPDIDSLAAGKGRVILLNKADLASEKANAAWITYFESQGFQVMKIDARAKATLKQLNALIQEACKEKIERDRRRGILNRPVRAMVVGIPNVGKSTFINSFAGRFTAGLYAFPTTYVVDQEGNIVGQPIVRRGHIPGADEGAQCPDRAGTCKQSIMIRKSRDR